MPELLMRQSSPYGTRRASVLVGEGDLYLYLEDLAAGPSPETASVVWVANHAPAPKEPGITAAPGAPPRMGASGTRHPEGCPPLDPSAHLVWFEEGDAVALVDKQGPVAVIPSWGGRDGFYGYARHAQGRCDLAWEMDDEAQEAFDRKVVESKGHWAWRALPAWPEIKARGLRHLEARLGPEETSWPIGETRFPEMIASRHRLRSDRSGDRDVWVTATTGLSAQRMPGVELYLDEPDAASRIELVIARPAADQAAADLLGALASIPFGRCTWLGEGHTIGGTRGSYADFGADKASVLLTAFPPTLDGTPAPDLSGLTQRNDPVTYLWVLLVDEEVFETARSRDAHTALAQYSSQGGSWLQ